MALFLFACAGKRPTDLGIQKDGRLAACPDSPNCVNSDAEDAEHRIEAFALKGEPDSVWIRVISLVKSTPRVTVVEETGNYLWAECRTAVFRFVDDLELYLQPESKIISVRSASRLGRSDMGVNRKRVERLRRKLQAADLLREANTSP